MSIHLPERWTKMNLHPKQLAMVQSSTRFKASPCGRRSGKTELKKRKLVRCAISHCKYPNARFIAAAPVRQQAKDIYWADLKALSPHQFIDDISETELTIQYINGASIRVAGMDEPARVEGRPLDGIVLDEYGNMKPQVWTSHVRPALIDHHGWADFIGVPEGRNHFFRLCELIRANESGEWSLHHWTTEEILPYYLGEEEAAQEIAAAKQDMDELTYQQEMLGSFVSFEGRAYYPFDVNTHASKKLDYDPKLDLIFCFDFNVAPGVAVVCQDRADPEETWCIGEVYIPQNSNTPAVCRKLIADWGKHTGKVFVYGDATGGAKGSAKVMGSDWELVTDTLRPVFGERLRMRVLESNPKERVRINAMNSRLKSATGAIKMRVCPKRCPRLITDLEGVVLLKGGSGEIDKKADDSLTHISDALGYFIERAHPIKVHSTKTQGSLI